MLTPKDWKKFQHYVDRRPPWIKLHRSILDDVKFQRLPVASRALAPMLWLYACEYDDGAISETWTDIAFRLRMSLEDFTRAVEPLIEQGFFISDDVAIEQLAPRKQNGALEREVETEKETEKEAEAEANIRAKPSRAPSRFDEFWKLYPRREGPNPRKPAEQRFDALVKTGVDPQMLIDEVRKFALLDDTRKNVGSRFIPQAATWLNQQRWSDHAAVSFLLDEELPKGFTIEQALAMYARMGVWSRHAPCAAPGEPGCTATPEQFAAVGLDPIGRKIQPPSEAA